MTPSLDRQVGRFQRGVLLALFVCLCASPGFAQLPHLPPEGQPATAETPAPTAESDG